ncbi:MAG: hypothetical protein PHW76_06695 [Alphaproteobacteria bacterium]|nr:hypothetical protein [Alphaproteobacteria bacterium]
MAKRLALLASLLLASCAHEVEVTYNCVPSGALIKEESIGYIGRCPAILRYNTFDDRVGEGVLYTNAIRVEWPSGASLRVPPTMLDVSEDRKTQMTFRRPTDYPNLRKDEMFAKAREEQILTPPVTWAVAKDQDRNIFDTMNKSLECGFAALTHLTTARCP